MPKADQKGKKPTRGQMLSEAWRVASLLAAGPRSAAELAAGTGLPLRKVYRVIEAMKLAGLPLEVKQPGKAIAGGGRVPARYKLRGLKRSEARA